jgi:hypothetical protein
MPDTSGITYTYSSRCGTTVTVGGLSRCNGGGIVSILKDDASIMVGIRQHNINNTFTMITLHQY